MMLLHLHNSIRMKTTVVFLCLCAMLTLFGAGMVQAESPNNQLRVLPLKSFQPNSVFWSPRLETYRTNFVPHSKKYIANSLNALHKACGDKVEGDLNGTWDEAVLYKTLESWAESLALSPDADLEKEFDEIVALVKRAQRPDGYVHAYIINEKINTDDPEKRVGAWWPNFLDGSHEGYVLGHLIEAAIAYYEATGKTEFLKIAQRAAIQAHNHFVRDAHPGFCGHAGLKMGLAELYRLDHDKRHLELIHAWIEQRGRGAVPWAEPSPGNEPTPRAYMQDGDVLRNMKTLEGHAVRALFFASGVADYALETGDTDYRLASNRFWESVTNRRMTITGNTGPRREHEALGEDYELPCNGYYESCAACALVDFSQRMFLLERHHDQADVMECALYNAVLHAISLDGMYSYYENPLSGHGSERHNSWVCCPPNIARTLLQLARYVLAYDHEKIYLNLFVGGDYSIPFEDGEKLMLGIQTEYPWNENVEITIKNTLDRPMELNIRIPGWCETTELKLNGQSEPSIRKTESGYYSISRLWKSGDRLSYRMEMPVVRKVAHPNIAPLHGKVALQRGPLVYAFEGIDQPEGLEPSQIELGTDPNFTCERNDALGGITVIHCLSEEGKELTAVPFYFITNRVVTPHEVWVKQRNLVPDSSWWAGRLYRKLEPKWISE